MFILAERSKFTANGKITFFSLNVTVHVITRYFSFSWKPPFTLPMIFSWIVSSLSH